MGCTNSEHLQEKRNKRGGNCCMCIGCKHGKHLLVERNMKGRWGGGGGRPITTFGREKQKGGQNAMYALGRTNCCMCTLWDKLLCVYCGTNCCMCTVVGQTAVCVLWWDKLLYVYSETNCCMCTVGQTAVCVLWDKMLYVYCGGKNCCM